jgi:hypothetical protein
MLSAVLKIQRFQPLRMLKEVGVAAVVVRDPHQKRKKPIIQMNLTRLSTSSSASASQLRKGE